MTFQRGCKTTVFKNGLIVIIGASLLGGCSFPSDYNKPAVTSINSLGYQQSFKDIQAIDWPDDTWWVRYGDSQLTHLIEKALAESPSIKMAEARLKDAQGIAQRIGAIKKVQVGLNASVSQSKVSYQYQAYMPPENWNDYGSVTLDFSYDLDFWGKNKDEVSAATSDYAAAQAEEASARLMISTSIANAYAELSRLYRDQDTMISAVGVRHKTVDLLTRRFNSGLETKGAVSRAKAAYANVQAELLNVKEMIALQKNAIAALTGSGPDFARSISRPQINLTKPFGLPENLGIGLLGHRPDICAARWRAQAAAQRIGVAEKSFYPDVRLSAFIGYQAFGLDNLTKTGNDAGSIGPAIYLPIFSGGRLEGQLDSARAGYELAVSQYNQSLSDALHQVADVVTSTTALDAQIKKMKEAVAAAKESHQIASNRYRGGLATYLDVLSAEDALLNSERALANLQAKAFSLDLSLIHALGGGYINTRSGVLKG
ncbi:AdeC/AdeK/OprM family multidrug efflux complex outer membrane factor [Vibrio salinus]|uniref:AdeC/AdeK/OprM family multidrug efflux complex outer membrane factor n=1 Tax=Vibrio salinus TaxID=2899784 RepID=UPI0035638E9D